MDVTYSQRIQKVMELLKAGLAPYVERRLQSKYKSDWADSVPRVPWQDGALRWDTANLLSTMCEQWHSVFASTMGHTERSLVSELREWRNKWAHQHDIEADDAYRIVDSAERLLKYIDAPESGAIARERQAILRLRLKDEALLQEHEPPLARSTSTITAPNPAAAPFVLHTTAQTARSQAISAKAIFGEIAGYPTGSTFENRADLSRSGVHRPTMAGICGTGKCGAESIVLSGGYEDDIDNGDVIIYTGQGGNDITTGEQTSDQTLTRGNQALQYSAVHGVPLRVIRGAKHKSPYSPSNGLRYDGLYRVQKVWSERGESGFLIWRFRIVKI